MRSVLRAGYSLIFWAFLTVSSAMLFPVALLIWLVTAPFDPRRAVLHQFTCLWASLYTWLNPAWRVRIVNRERLTREPTVMIANHLSLLDILVVHRLFHHYKWVSKIENFRVPFVGWNMSLNRYIRLKRGDRTSIIQMMRECEAALAKGSSVMIFPEGTRSPSGLMRSFRHGAFELALKTRRPIQPLVIQGSSDALPKRGFVLQGRHDISLTVLDALPPESFEHDSVEELTARVHELLAKHVATEAPRRSRSSAP